MIRPAAHTLRQQVFLYVLNQGSMGATLEEIEHALQLPGNTVRPRRIELEEKGFVIDSKKTRKTASGRSAIVWIVPEPIATKAKERLYGKTVA
jgi:predicted ArsR family transcriptional regulator